MNRTDMYIVKLCSLRIPHSVIAAKLGMTVEALGERLCQIEKEQISEFSKGYAILSDTFTRLTFQYQQVGNSLKEIGGMMGAIMDDVELARLIGNTPEETLTNLRTKAIVLRPPTEQLDPAKVMEAAEAKVIEKVQAN
jgi:hypothetical protein